MQNHMILWEGDLVHYSLTCVTSPNQQGPVVIVPTKYFSTPTQTFRDMGVATVIWANHNLRAAVSAMQYTSQEIYNSQTLSSIEPKVRGGSQVSGQNRVFGGSFRYFSHLSGAYIPLPFPVF